MCDIIYTLVKYRTDSLLRLYLQNIFIGLRFTKGRGIKVKKFVGLILAAAMMMTNSAFAEDFTYEYKDFVANVVVPQSGLCDFAKSYTGHENEYAASEYFSGIISAFRMDIDADGNQELVLVGDNLIRVYKIVEGEPSFCASYIVNMVCDYGEAYSNVFVKNFNDRDYLCVESYTDSGSEKSYKFRMMYMNGGDTKLYNQCSIEKTYKDDYSYESANALIGDRNTSYSKSTVSGTATSVNPDKYKDLYDAAWQMLYNLGFEKPSFLNSVNRLLLNENNTDMHFQLTKLISDISLKTYVRAKGVRTAAKPIVYFEDHSELSALNIAPEPTTAPTPTPEPTAAPTEEPVVTDEPTETPVPVEEEITVTIDGKKLDFADQGASMINNRTLVPMRAIFEALGANVDWLQEYKTVIAETPDTKIIMRIDESIYYVNSAAFQLDVPAQLVNDRTMIPARAVAEALGCNVDWVQDTKMVVITTAN